MREYTEHQRLTLLRMIADGDAAPPCPKCGGACTVFRARPRSDVAYVRDRVVARCPACRATCVAETPGRRAAVRGVAKPAAIAARAALAAAAVAAALAAPPAQLQAQHPPHEGESGCGPGILELHYSIRASAMGGAYWVGGGRDNLAILHHAALISGSGFGFSHQRYGTSTHLSMGGGAEWMGGTIAAGVSFVEYSTNAHVPSELPRAAAGFIDGGDLASADFLATVGYAKRVAGLDVGVAAKLIGQRTADVRGRALAVDLGIARELGPLAVAATVQNLGPEMRVGDDEFPLARRYVVGIGSRRRVPVGPFDIGGVVQAGVEGDGAFVPRAGVELGWWPVQNRVFLLRAGMLRVPHSEAQSSAFTMGAGFEGDRIQIDYARRTYAGDHHTATTHSIGVSLR